MRGLGPGSLLNDESDRKRGSPSVCSGASPKGTDWPKARSSHLDLQQEKGEEPVGGVGGGGVRGLWLQLSHLPREAVLTSGRPGSKHSVIPMETAVQD